MTSLWQEKQIKLSHDPFFSGKAKLFVASPIFGKNAKKFLHDQNFAEKAKFKKLHGQGLSSKKNYCNITSNFSQ